MLWLIGLKVSSLQGVSGAWLDDFSPKRAARCSQLSDASTSAGGTLRLSLTSLTVAVPDDSASELDEDCAWEYVCPWPSADDLWPVWRDGVVSLMFGVQLNIILWCTPVLWHFPILSRHTCHLQLILLIRRMWFKSNISMQGTAGDHVAKHFCVCICMKLFSALGISA